MSNVEKIIAAFVPQFEAAIRADALDRIAAVLGPTPPTVTPARYLEIAPDGKLAARPEFRVERDRLAALEGAKPRVRKGAKRTPEELAATAKDVRKVIAESKGVTAEQIKAALGVDLKTIELPIAKLLEAKAIRKTGNKRATRYFAK